MNDVLAGVNLESCATQKSMLVKQRNPKSSILFWLRDILHRLVVACSWSFQGYRSSL
jgi:hypothetical protein